MWWRKEVLVSGLKLGDTCCRKSSKLGDKNPMKNKVPHNKGKAHNPHIPLQLFGASSL
jgi:hypothetical protein